MKMEMKNRSHGYKIGLDMNTNIKIKNYIKKLLIQRR